MVFLKLLEPVIRVFVYVQVYIEGEVFLIQIVTFLKKYESLYNSNSFQDIYRKV